MIDAADYSIADSSDTVAKSGTFTLAAGQTVDISISGVGLFTLSTSGSQSGVTTVTTTNCVAPTLTPTNTSTPTDTATALPTVTPSLLPDLSIAKTHQFDFSSGLQSSYFIAISNIGTDSTNGPIVVTDVLPDGLTYLLARGTDWVCSAAGQAVTCIRNVALPPGESASDIEVIVRVDIVVAPGTTDTIVNTASVDTANDSNLANNSASDTTLIIPRITPTYTFTPSPSVTPTPTPSATSTLVPTSTNTKTPTITPTSTSTNPPNLHVTAICTAQDVATFTITNNGGDMSSPGTFNITNSGGTLLETGLFTLAAGQHRDITWSGIGLFTLSTTGIQSGVTTSATTNCVAPSSTPTFTPTFTKTPTIPPTFSKTPTITPTFSRTPTVGLTFTKTPTNTPTNTLVPPTSVPSSTPSDTPTLTPTSSPQLSASQSLMHSYAVTVAADNTSFSTITVTALDDASSPLSGRNVQLYIDPSVAANIASGVTIQAQNPVTDANGKARFSVRSSTQGNVTFRAIVDTTTLNATTAVFFLDPSLPTPTPYVDFGPGQ
jgi:hypothetical protein